MWDRPHLLMWFANLLYAVAALMMVYAVLFVVVNLPSFPVRHIRVSGELQHITREQVELVARKQMRGTFFTLDLNKTRAQFEKLPWVRKATVRRRWPDELLVELEEHVVLGRWGDQSLVNSYGELFDAAAPGPLPVLSGPAGSARDVVQQYVQFSALLKPLALEVAALQLSPRRAWQVTLQDEMVIEVGREDVEARLQRFVEAYPRTLGKASSTLRYVDLRYPNGFAVRLPKGVGLGKPAETDIPAGKPKNKPGKPPAPVKKVA